MNIVLFLFLVALMFLFICLGICRYKCVPDDVGLFVVCLFAGVFYLLGNINALYSADGFWWLFGPFIIMVVGPLFYSFYFQRKKQVGVDRF